MYFVKWVKCLNCYRKLDIWGGEVTPRRALTGECQNCPPQDCPLGGNPKVGNSESLFDIRSCVFILLGSTSNRSNFSSRLTLVLTCAMKFNKYPHDEQICKLSMESCKLPSCLIQKILKIRKSYQKSSTNKYPPHLLSHKSNSPNSNITQISNYPLICLQKYSKNIRNKYEKQILWPSIHSVAHNRRPDIYVARSRGGDQIPLS